MSLFKGARKAEKVPLVVAKPPPPEEADVALTMALEVSAGGCCEPKSSTTGVTSMTPASLPECFRVGRLGEEAVIDSCVDALALGNRSRS